MKYVGGARVFCALVKCHNFCIYAVEPEGEVCVLFSTVSGDVTFRNMIWFFLLELSKNNVFLN